MQTKFGVRIDGRGFECDPRLCSLLLHSLPTAFGDGRQM